MTIRAAGRTGPEFLPAAIAALQPCFWENPRLEPAAQVLPQLDVTRSDMEEAQARWRRFQPLFVRLFPQTASTDGHIDSALLDVTADLDLPLGSGPDSRIFVKADHDLPVTGCIKARGGIYEVLTIAERIALEKRLVSSPDDMVALAGAEARKVLGNYRIMVGSTGNLGYSVGVISRALGFEAEVHMSRDAKEWKKKRLRDMGVNVVDDEDSRTLFVGYSTAAFDLVRQLAEAGVEVGPSSPVNVYLPCGVGGAPGGIAFGLKTLLGDDVRCYFVEPVNAPCMLVELAGAQAAPSLEELGISGETIADGLAVASASRLVAGLVARLVDGCFTCTDDRMLEWVRRIWARPGLRLEPSAAAGFCALSHLLGEKTALGATHIVWTTGGAQLPDAEFLALIGDSQRS
jgi:D-serine dehydratase